MIPAADWKSDLLRRARRIMRVHGEIPLVAGLPGSPLDARAMQLSTGVVEAAFAAAHGFEDIARPFHRFFAPAARARSDQALKKALNLIIEERMRILALRADPPAHNGFGANPVLPEPGHILDPAAAAALDLDAPAASRGAAARLRSLAAAAARAARLLMRTSWIGIRYGRLSVRRAEFTLGAPTHSGIGEPGRWAPLEAAAREAGLWRDGAIAVVDEHGGFDRPCPYPVIRPAEFPVPFLPWLRLAVWPSFRLAAALIPRAFVWAWSDPLRVQLAYEALVMAEQSLILRRVCLSRRFRFYLDVEESSQRHIVRAMVLEAAGGRLVRWAHGIIDADGVMLGFLGYHDFLSFGPYHRPSFSSALASQRDINIGMIRNDRRITADESVAAQYRTLVEQHKASGGRLMVYFMPGSMPGLDTAVRRTLDALARQMAVRQGWLLIVKPKSPQAYPFAPGYLREHAHTFSNNGANAAAMIEHDSSGRKVCDAGWLIRQMDLGVGINTVQVETLCVGKPGLSYYPVVRKTPFFDRARAAGLAFKDPDAFEAAVGEWMDSPERPVPIVDWCREQFEPFADGDALGRAARHLFGAA